MPIVYSLGPNFPPNPALGARPRRQRRHPRRARRPARGRSGASSCRNPTTGSPACSVSCRGASSAEVNYSGIGGRNLLSGDGPGGEDYNRFSGDLLDGVRNRLNPSFGAVGLNESRIDSNYHGLTLQLNRRFDRGFASRRPTRYGNAKDYPGTAEEVTELELDYGNAGFDVRHKLAINFIWQHAIRTGQRDAGNTRGRMAVERDHHLPVGGAVHRDLHAPYPRATSTRTAMTNDRSTCRPSAPISAASRRGVAGGRICSGRLPAPGSGHAADAAAQRVPRSWLLQHGPVAVQELHDARLRWPQTRRSRSASRRSMCSTRSTEQPEREHGEHATSGGSTALRAPGGGRQGEVVQLGAKWHVLG